MKKIIFLCLVVTALACKQKGKLPESDLSGEMVVAVQPQLALREGHDVKSKILKQIPYGEKVKIVPGAGYSGGDVQILGLSGRWQRVEYNNVQGWVFAPLLKKTDEKYSIVVLNGNANIDDQSVQPTGSNAEIIRDTQRAQVEITIPYTDSTTNCEGALVLRGGGSISPRKGGHMRCGGVSGDAVYTFSQWLVFKGRIYVTGVNNGNGVCHSERCEDKDMSYSETAAKAFAVTGKSKEGIYQAQLVDDFH